LPDIGCILKRNPERHDMTDRKVAARRRVLTLLAGAIGGIASLTGRAAFAAPAARMVTAVAIAKAKPGQEDELGRRMAELVAPTLAEPGCINYDLHRSNSDPGTWMFYENWRTQADLDAHMKSAHFANFFAKADEVLAHVDAYQLSLIENAGRIYRRC
jgi:quinol monooxygenase YgiN